MTRTKIKLMVTLLAVLFHLSSLIYAATLQGKLEKFGSLGILPAPVVAVTLNASGTDTIIKTAFTDSEGIFYFNECQPGIYILKIWGKGIDDRESLNFEVTVLDQPVTNISPLLMHSLNFKYPTEGQIFPQQVDIKAKGTHYNIPEDVFVWLILRNRDGNYYLPTDCAVKINADETWESRPINIMEGTIEILAVLVTREYNNKFRLMAGSIELKYFANLPKTSRIIAQRKISGPPIIFGKTDLEKGKSSWHPIDPQDL